MARPGPPSSSQSTNHPRLPTSQSAYVFNNGSHVLQPSRSSASLAFDAPAVAQGPDARGRGGPGHGVQRRTSRTWTSSSGDLGLLSDTDEVDDRSIFVQEYNRLAKKHGLRLLVVDDFDLRQQPQPARAPEKRGWLHRIFRSSSTNGPVPPPVLTPADLADPSAPRRKRSVSDVAHGLAKTRREVPKSMDLQAMVRLSGKSVLYLPPEYAPSSLVLPTCLRATAQHLAQHVATRGIFRIPGSIRIVNALCDYYCFVDDNHPDIASTVRCANLPVHIQASVHDVASTFKRLLSTLPGGVLGSLSVFDAMVAIQSQLQSDPEYPRTKQTKVRARLIALAISTIKSQFRRELICSVFGLLSYIGRVAETAPREDDNGRPMPTTDLMGYGALGIVFGPLLISDLLDEYTMELARPDSGLLVLPLIPHVRRRDRRKSKAADTKPKPPGSAPVDKILVANSITEMLITNWRDVVRHMQSLGTCHRNHGSAVHVQGGSVRPVASSQFVLKKPRDWDQPLAAPWSAQSAPIRDRSPEPDTPTMAMRKQRSTARRSLSSNKIIAKPSVSALSPTAEESLVDEEEQQTAAQNRLPQPHEKARKWPGGDRNGFSEAPADSLGSPQKARGRDTTRSPQVSMDDVPPRLSSKPRSQNEGPWPLEHVTPPTTLDYPHHIQSAKDMQFADSGQRHSRVQSSRTSSRPRGSRPDPSTNARVLDHGTSTPSQSSAVGATRPSEASLVSFPSARRAIEKRMGQPRAENSSLGSDISAELSSLANDLNSIDQDMSPKTSGRNDSAHFRGSSEDFEADKGLGLQGPQGQSYFRLSQDGSIQQRYKLSTARDSTDRRSGNTTPKQFLAPMRVPPSLSVQLKKLEESPPHARPMTGNNPQKASQWGPSTPLGDPDSPSRAIRKDGAQPTPSSKADWPSGSGTWPRMVGPSDAQGPSSSSSRGASTVRPNVSEVASKRGAVRAMAAVFNNDEPAAPRSGGSKRNNSMVPSQSQHTQDSSTRSVRPSKSVPLRPALGSEQPSSWADKQATRDGLPAEHRTRENEEKQSLKTSASDSVALRAAAIMEAEKRQHDSSPRQRPKANLRPAIPWQRPDFEQKDRERQNKHAGKDPPNLGTMIPHVEQPPIAQHLNLPRPASTNSAFTALQDSSVPSETGAAAPLLRPGSTSGLHSQIRNLQRQLYAKTEETMQLRKQLEAQGDADIGTLSEQLREARREVQMWKERAEAAERRVKVFEKFTARLRGIREAAATSMGETAATDGWPNRKQSGTSCEEEGRISPNQHVQFVEDRRCGDRSTLDEGSCDTGVTEDAGTVTARIRRCLHRSRTLDHYDGPAGDELLGLDGSTRAPAPAQGSPAQSQPRPNLDESVEKIWEAAEELLRMEEHGVMM